ncbi:hypothetical protein HK101_010740 [Irineochytrium annulatum]|nr:hypothetical protein HK101_010740 [Irineochytrium annulatum]
MGSVASVQLGLTLFPTSRDNVLAQALNVNFDDGLKFHKVSGAWTVVFGVVHFVLYTISTFQTGLTSANKSKYLKKLFLVDIPSDMRTWHAYMGILGLVGTTIFIWVAFNSFSFIRRRSYAWFYINHLLVLFAIIAISLHASTAFYFVLPGILMYAVDGVKRVFYVTAGKRTTITSITRERNNYIRVAISGLTARRLQPGQWISLNVPSIDRIKFHPFTIITVHHTHAGAARGGDVEILVKPSERVGSWTKALEALAGASAAKLPLKSVFVELTTDDAADGKGDDKKAAVTSTDTAFVVSTEHVSGDSAAHDLSIPCLVQGPFGTLPRNFLSSTTVLIVCAGSGVSGGLVIARACLAHTPRPDVRMLWTTHDGGSEEVEAWREMEELKVTEGCLREVTLHRTGGGRGRVDVKALMARWRGEVEGDVSVYTCGPASFTQAVMRESGVFEKRIVHAEGFVR